MAFVYFFRSGERDAFKIGKTGVKVFDRKKALGTGNPDRLSEFAVIEMPMGDHTRCESFLHGLWGHRRIFESDGTEWYRLTVSEAEEAIESAQRYLEVDVPRLKEAERLNKFDSESGILQPSDDEWQVYQQILERSQEKYVANLELERLQTRLKLLIGTSSGLDGIATWKTRRKRTLHQPSFKADHPALFERYLRPSQDRPFKIR